MADWTLRSLIDSGMTVTAYCHNPRCNHWARLPLVLLSDKYGLDAPAMHIDLAHKLVCMKCGGRKCGLRYAPDPDKHTGMGVGHGNLYQRMRDGR